LAADPGRLAGILRGVPTVAPDGQPPDMVRVVLVVDQFEETFALCADEQQRQLFIRALCAGATSSDSRQPIALVVLGLRADFYGNCAAHPELVDALRHGQVLLGAMDMTELREAIEKPAHAVGMEVQPGLVEVMLGDLGADDSGVAGAVRYEPGALPLLSHALLTTWQQRHGRTLTVGGYRLTGGIRGAIADTAERAYRQLDPAGQRIARQLLMRMIRLGEGTDDTRRRLDRIRLTGDVADPAAVETVLDVLARAVWSPCTPLPWRLPTRPCCGLGRGCASGSTLTGLGCSSSSGLRRPPRHGTGRVAIPPASTGAPGWLLPATGLTPLTRI
jgi:hypothetical protein